MGGAVTTSVLILRPGSGREFAYIDYQYTMAEVRKDRPEFGMLPSEYFHRQVSGCFWFEDGRG